MSIILEYEGRGPDIHPSVFIAPNAAIIGNVVVGEHSSIWFSATLRADHEDNAIRIGRRTSIQDGCIVHVSSVRGTHVGDDVTVGHGAILEGCTVGNRVVVGMNAVVLEGAVIGEGSMIGAGSVVSAGMHVPPGVLVAGVPAQIKKPISGEAAQWIQRSAPHYVELASRYRAMRITEQ